MRKLNGFSLMEAMVVMLIVAVLAAVSAPMVNKRLLSELAEKQPWVYVDNNENIAFNLKASDTMTAMIGASSTPQYYHPKLYLRTDKSNAHPHITFGDKFNKTLNLFATDGNIWFSNSNPFKNNNEAFATNSVVLGKDANASANNTVSIGSSANATANNTVAIGKSASADKDGGIAIGASAKAAAIRALALGGQVADTSAIVIGNLLQKNISQSDTHYEYIRIGKGNSSNQYNSDWNSIAIGKNLTAGSSAIAIGDNATATGDSSIALMRKLNNKDYKLGNDSIAIGKITTDFTKDVSTGSNSISIGRNVRATAENSIALGFESEASETSSIAIGSNSTSSNKNSISIGNNSTANKEEAIAFGYKSSAESTASIALGFRSKTANATATNAIAIGVDANAIGSNSIAIGYGAKASGTNSIAIGSGAESDGNNKIVLGNSDSVVYIPGALIVGGSATLNDNDAWKGSTAVRLNGTMYTLGIGTYTDVKALDYSDRRLKNIGKAFTGGLEEIKKLEVFNYTFKKDKEKTPRVGIMAQDLQKIFPQAVFKGEDGFLRIRMEDIFYSLVNAIKELDKKIEKLKINDIFTLKNRIENLKNENQMLEKRLNDLEQRINNL